MTEISFPTSPSVNDFYTFANRTWQWNGTAWTTSQPSVGGTPQTDLGTVTSGTATANVALSSEQKLTVGGNLTIAFSNWPSSGTYGEVEIELVNGGAHTITWPTINWRLGDGSSSTTFTDMNVTLQSSGTNFLMMWSTNGGTTLYGRAS